MKKMMLFMIIMISSSFVYAIEGGNGTTIEEKYKGIKVLKDLEIEDVKIEIKRPDNASRMPRMETVYVFSKKNELKDKIIKSNKLLY